MKCSRRQVRGKAHALPVLKFESQSLTSFSGLVVLQQFFALLLFCTIAQTGQVLDFLHRSGNVHDSHGAEAFILACIQAVREALPGVLVEIRMDSAFFSGGIVLALDDARIEFSVSVPFERFVELKGKIEGRKRWRRLGAGAWYFEESWKPKVWQRRFRFLFIRTLAKRQHKGPIQLDPFLPYEYGYDFKVPVRKWLGNQMYLLAGLMAHNLLRELHMITAAPSRHTTEKRTPLWAFEQLDTFRAALIQRAGRLTRPHGKLTLTISASHCIKNRLLNVLKALQNAA